jgi:hypothetical protein
MAEIGIMPYDTLCVTPSCFDTPHLLTNLTFVEVQDEIRQCGPFTPHVKHLVLLNRTFQPKGTAKSKKINMENFPLTPHHLAIIGGSNSRGTSEKQYSRSLYVFKA